MTATDLPAMVTFTMRAPGRYISMNDRDRWRPHATRVKAWRTLTALSARNLAAPCPADVHVQLDVRDARRRDPHNLYPTIKAIVDGLTDAGCWPDDTPEYVTTHEPTFRTVHGQPLHVTVTITRRLP